MHTKAFRLNALLPINVACSIINISETEIEKL